MEVGLQVSIFINIALIYFVYVLHMVIKDRESVITNLWRKIRQIQND